LKELKILIPERLYNMLERIEKEQKIRKEDIVLRTLIKVVETYLGEKAYGT